MRIRKHANIHETDRRHGVMKLKKRMMACVMAVAMVVTSAQIPVTTAQAATELVPEEAFVLKDGNFTLGDTYWNTFSMVWEGYTTNATFTPDAEGMTVEINDVGANGEYAGLWTVALQQDATLYAGNTYKVSFDLTSSIRRAFSFGVEKTNENKDTVFEQVTGIRESAVNEKQTFTYEYKCTEDTEGKFYINLGAPAKGTSLDPHTIKISNVKMEVEGAREQWVLVDDSTFDNTDVYNLNGGTTTNGYVALDNNGTITYPNLQVNAGDKYQLTFAARAEENAQISAKLGDAQLAGNVAVEKYTNVYTYTYVATETKTVDLQLNVTGGKTYIDNIGLWNPNAKDALGLGEEDTELDAAGIAIAATQSSYTLGSDVTLNVTADNFDTWVAAGPQVLVNGKTLDASLYTMTDGKITILADAFGDIGTVAITVVTPGYEKSRTSVKVIKANGDLIDNGDFENDLNGWSPYFNERYSGSAEITNDFMAKITISFFLNWYDEAGNDKGPVNWSTMLTHDQIEVKGGKIYNISFYASSTVERPILLEVGSQKYSFKLTPELQKFTATYDNEWGADEKITFRFLLGPIEENAAGNETGIGYTKTDGHTMLFTDVSMVEEGNEADAVKKPSVVGIENGASYSVPVSARVNYRNDYTVALTKNGSAVDYTVGDLIKDNGDYVLTVTDKADTSIQTQKKFTIEKDIDYSKEYYVIASKSTEKVIEAVGFTDGGSVVQSAFAGKPGQFFTLEEVRKGYVALRALSSGKVVQVAGDAKDAGDKLEQAEYTGANKQLWKIVNVPQGFVKLENKASGKVIDISGAMKTEGLPLQQAANTGSGDEGQQSIDGQRFDLIRMNPKEYLETKEDVVKTESDWVEKAFITPIADKLNPAGPIAVEWYAAPGNVTSYDVYFDGKKCKTVTATDEDTLKTEDKDIYSTKVAEHTMKIVANYSGKTVETKEIKFYITKKGVGWATLHRTEDMNLSWYYHWALDPALGTDEDLTFVPMIWSDYGASWLADPANKKYGTVLSFNEPDWSDQSNVPVTIKSSEEWTARYNKAYGTNRTRPSTVEEAWQSFMDSGLRVGSPATALAPPYCNGSVTMNEVDGPDNWWFDFMDLMDSHEGWDYDFTAIHSYNDGCDAKAFLDMIDQTYELNHKPIWITEFGVAEWGEGKWKSNAKTRQQVKEFMIEVIEGLEERDFVERYAWFPFDPDDAYGGASGIFNYATGELTELGQTYAMLGLPEGYEGASYDVDIALHTVPAEQVSIEDLGEIDTEVKIGDVITLSATATPADTTDKVTWVSSNSDIATVDSNGKVTIKNAGTVTITAVAGEKTQGITFKVAGPEVPVVNVEINKSQTELYVGQSMTLRSKVTPQDATNRSLTYKSSNESIATVDPVSGNVTAKKAGVVVISATADSQASDLISITIKERPTNALEEPTTEEETTTIAQETTTVETTVAVKVGKTKVKKATKKKAAKKLKVTLKKISGAKGYQVAVYKTKKTAKKNKKALVKKFVKKVKATISSKKLKKKKALFVKARAYKKVNGTKKYGKWSKVKKAKIK